MGDPVVSKSPIILKEETQDISETANDSVSHSYLARYIETGLTLLFHRSYLKILPRPHAGFSPFPKYIVA